MGSEMCIRDRYRFDPSSLVAFDGVEIDPAIVDKGSATITPNLSIGLFYKSSGSYKEQSHYYFGVSANQLFPGRIINTLDLRAAPHMTMHGGYRKWFDRSKHYLEPNVMVIYGFKNALHAMLNIRYERNELFWVSVGGGTNRSVFLQTGAILTGDSFLGGLVRDGYLRIGVKGEYNLGSLGKYAGIGYEGYIAYLFDIGY